MARSARIGDRHVNSDTNPSRVQHCLWHRSMLSLMVGQHCFPSRGCRLVSILVKHRRDLVLSCIRRFVGCDNGFVIIIVGEQHECIATVVRLGGDQCGLYRNII